MKLTRRQIFAGWVAVASVIAFPVKPPYNDAVQQLVRALEAGNYEGSDLTEGRPLKIESLEGTLRNVTYDNKHLILA